VCCAVEKMMLFLCIQIDHAAIMITSIKQTQGH
jgi:hypothetical protein